MFRLLYNWLSSSRNVPNTRVAVLPGRSTLWLGEAGKGAATLMRPVAEHVLGCCQTKSNRSQSTTITQIYEAQI